MKTSEEIKKNFYEVNRIAKIEQLASIEFQNEFLIKQDLKEINLSLEQRDAIIKNNKKNLETLKRELKFLEDFYLKVEKNHNSYYDYRDYRGKKNSLAEGER